MSDLLSSTFAALADPTRRAILATLAKGETTVQALADPFDMSLPAVSKHLKVLERAGLIERGRDAQYRPCRLRPEGLKQVASWIEHYRKFWEESFDRLEIVLREMQTAEKQKTRAGHTGARPRRASLKGRKNVNRRQKRKDA